MENPTQADLFMSALLKGIGNRTKEYIDDIQEFEEIDDLSNEYKRDLESLVKRYQNGVQDILRQQEEVAEAQEGITP